MMSALHQGALSNHPGSFSLSLLCGWNPGTGLIAVAILAIALSLIYVWQRSQGQEHISPSDLSKERWQLALQGNNDGVWDWNVRTNEVFFSRRWKEMLGYADDEITNQLDEWSQRVHPEDLEEAIALIQDHFAGKQPFYISEHRIQCKDGSYKWILDRGQAIWDETGTVIRMIGSHTDITERKQAEEALAKELLRTQTFLNTSMDGIVMLDQQGKVVQASLSFARMLGYSVEETQQLQVTDWDAQWAPEELQQMLQGTPPLPPMFETRHRRRDGSVYDVEISYSLVTLDNQITHFCICRDISERKRNEAQRQQVEELLKFSQAQFKAVVANMPGMVYRHFPAREDSPHRFTFVSSHAYDLLGVPPQAIIRDANVFLNLIHPEDRHSFESSLQDATRQFLAWHWEGRIITASGQLKWVEGNSQAQSTLAGAAWDGLLLDISDRKRVEAALRRAMEAAESANLAKSMFLANMSHELRTPLNVILGFTQVMVHDASLTASQKQDLQTIRRSGDHLLSLINDVLDLSKIEAGHYTLEETAFDLRSLIYTLYTMMSERASAKHLELAFEIAPDVPQFVSADEQKLRQILLNLLSNAIKFTQQGSVTLRVQIEKFTSTLAPTIPLQFQVIDTGVGIAAAEQSTIFDAFVQADAGKKSISGTGLGLTISHRLMELMQGRITVESSPGAGSTFTCYLPVRSTSSLNVRLEAGDRTVIGLAPHQPQRRILVVDDQPENRFLMVRLLSQMGLEVREASNGQEAVQLWQEWQPDLTWMDICMPDIDGYEATRQIRAMESQPTCVIIALTAQASQGDRQLAQAAGCNDYISKPFQAETIFLKLAEYLDLQYIYADSTPIDPPGCTTRATSIQAEATVNPTSWLDLSTMPPEWLSELEQAATCGNDRAISALVQQLPPHLTPIGEHLVALAHQFQFEPLLELLHTHSST